jgi:hypothetical protein
MVSRAVAAERLARLDSSGVRGVARRRCAAVRIHDRVDAPARPRTHCQHVGSELGGGVVSTRSGRCDCGTAESREIPGCGIPAADFCLAAGRALLFGLLRMVGGHPRAERFRAQLVAVDRGNCSLRHPSRGGRSAWDLSGGRSGRPHARPRAAKSVR